MLRWATWVALAALLTLLAPGSVFAQSTPAAPAL
jgi:hypothetical protein